MKNIIYRIEFDLIELMEAGARSGGRIPETGDRKWKTGARGGGRIPETGDRKWKTGARGGGRIPETGHRKWKIGARSGVQGSLESLGPR